MASSRSPRRVLLFLAALLTVAAGEAIQLPLAHGNGLVHGEQYGFAFEEPNLPQPEKTDLPRRGLSDCASRKVPEQNRPRVAIIIDDMGYHEHIGNSLLALPLELTFSFLPHAPFSRQQEQTAFQQGRDILIHLPMEAQDPTWNLGPGALHLNQSADQLLRIARENIAAVPHAMGANNHMGSRFTEDLETMRLVLDELKKQDLFFIDSFTSSRTTGISVAREIGLPAARRDIFLDNNHDEELICRQLEELIAVADQQGWAIGIGHPNQATLSALTDCRQCLVDQVEIVGVHHLLTPSRSQ